MSWVFLGLGAMSRLALGLHILGDASNIVETFALPEQDYSKQFKIHNLTGENHLMLQQLQNSLVKDDKVEDDNPEHNETFKIEVLNLTDMIDLNERSDKGFTPDDPHIANSKIVGIQGSIINGPYHEYHGHPMVPYTPITKHLIPGAHNIYDIRPYHGANILSQPATARLVAQGKLMFSVI